VWIAVDALQFIESGHEIAFVEPVGLLADAHQPGGAHRSPIQNAIGSLPARLPIARAPLRLGMERVGAGDTTE